MSKEEGPESPGVWHSLDQEDLLSKLNSRSQGLSSEEADKRLQTHGLNRLEAVQGKTLFARLLEQLNNRFIYILLVAAVLTGILQLWLDTVLILAVIVISALAGLFQEGRARRALEAMQSLLSPNARVLRDGKQLTIGAEQLVPGDIVLLERGDRVPADLRLLSTNGLQIDEAVLIGHTSPILKGAAALDEDTPLVDRTNIAYASTLVLDGQARGLVVATGADTELGGINTFLEEHDSYTTPLTTQLKWLINGVALVLLSVAALIIGFGYLTPGMEGHTPAELLKSVASLAVAAVPEGLPALFALVLGISMQRLAGHQVMVRKLAAVETLGSVSTICADKSYTLTRHEPTVHKVLTGRGGTALHGMGYKPEGELVRENFDDSADRADLHMLARAAVLASDAQLSEVEEGEWEARGEPLEAALLTMAHKVGLDPAQVRNGHNRLAVIPFSRTYRYMAVLSASSDNESHLYVKGAPEALLPRCTHVLTDSGPEPFDKSVWEEKVHKLADQGMQALVVACKPVEDSMTTLAHEDVGYGLTLLGVVGISDPPREESARAVALCQQAGIRVKMITGDHALTACALAKKVGIGDGETVLTGAQLDEMDDEALSTAIRDVDVFARTSPEQKLRLVKTLQAQDERVAMLGGGLNDAPALKQADVGVAMGMRGTEAARQAADIVLTRDHFPSLADAIREGRLIHQNFYKIVQFMIPVASAQALVVIAAVLFGLALPLTPAQILWVNLVVAGILGLTLAFEQAEPDIMRKSGMDHSPSLFSGFLLWRLILVSVLLFGSVMAIFVWELHRGEALEVARTAAINTLVIGQIFYLFSVRHSTVPGWRLSNLFNNQWLWFSVGGMLILQTLFTYWAPFNVLFGTDAIDPPAWSWILLAGSLVFIVVEFEKGMQRNARGWVQSVVRKVFRHFDPRFWKEKGLRWTLQFFAILFLIMQLLLAFLWSREPDTFDVEANAREMVRAEAGQTLKPGVLTTATLTRLAGTLLDKPGGYTSNDVSMPSVAFEHMLVVPDIPNWEFGVLTQVRDFSLAMRDDFSRSQSQSATDPDLVTAQIRFNTDGNLWLFPPAETQFREGVDALENYLQRLQNGEAQFYTRADNLNNWLTKVQRQMGSLSIALSASVGIRQVQEEGAAMTIADSSAQTPGVELEVIDDGGDQSEVLVKTPRLRVDDVFYQARGQTWAILHLLKAIEADFEDVLRQKNALVSLRQIINKLEDAQEDIWSPVILNGRGYSFVANHSLVLASQISRANAALIDLGTLMREG
ncbi:MAG: HAD-IC family P-type ATPase [Thiolinea sp.]